MATETPAVNTETTTTTKKKLTKQEADELKKQGALRAQFVRQHCFAWMKQNKAAKLAAFEEAAWKKYPKGEKSNEFELDESLLAE